MQSARVKQQIGQESPVFIESVQAALNAMCAAGLWLIQRCEATYHVSGIPETCVVFYFGSIMVN